MTQNIPDKSLFRCTLKKSADVTAKVVLYASYAVVGVTAAVLAIYGMLACCAAIWELIKDAVHYLAYIIANGVVGGLALLVSIPWYVYAGVVAVAAIPVYSFLWCVARELTEEDYQSDTAKVVAFLLVLVARALGGDNSKKNLVLCCKSCNGDKARVENKIYQSNNKGMMSIGDIAEIK